MFVKAVDVAFLAALDHLEERISLGTVELNGVVPFRDELVPGLLPCPQIGHLQIVHIQTVQVLQVGRKLKVDFDCSDGREGDFQRCLLNLELLQVDHPLDLGHGQVGLDILEHEILFP